MSETGRPGEVSASGQGRTRERRAGTRVLTALSLCRGTTTARYQGCRRAGTVCDTGTE
jgi:hypothetical protein